MVLSISLLLLVKISLYTKAFAFCYHLLEREIATTIAIAIVGIDIIIEKRSH